MFKYVCTTPCTHRDPHYQKVRFFGTGEPLVVDEAEALKLPPHFTFIGAGKDKLNEAGESKFVVDGGEDPRETAKRKAKEDAAKSEAKPEAKPEGETKEDAAKSKARKKSGKNREGAQESGEEPDEQTAGAVSDESQTGDIA